MDIIYEAPMRHAVQLQSISAIASDMGISRSRVKTPEEDKKPTRPSWNDHTPNSIPLSTRGDLRRSKDIPMRGVR